MAASNEPLSGSASTSTPEASALAGTPYRAVSLLGSGGMGEVYLADHIELGKRFVVKLLHQNMVKDPRLVDRTRIEAQALARLKHPSIVQVTDFGRTEAGRPYLVMEWLRGSTLGDEIRRRSSLPLGEAVAITRELLGALHVAHAVGIVHRDIKPGNLFLHQLPGQPRTLKVLDFGIAKVVAGAPDDAPRPLLHPTEEGVIIGTPRFISPEAIAGHDIDHRADLYSVALVLYTMLCGRGPWDRARRPGQLLSAQLRDAPVRPSELAAQHIPPELDAVVLKALSKSRDDRYQSAAEFDAALASVPLDVPARSGEFETAIFGGPPVAQPSSRSPVTARPPASPDWPVASSGNVTFGGAISESDLDPGFQTTLPVEHGARVAPSVEPRGGPTASLGTQPSATAPTVLASDATEESGPPSSVAREPRAIPTEPISEVVASARGDSAQATRTAVPLPAPITPALSVEAALAVPVSRRGIPALVRFGVTAVAFGVLAWWLLGLLSR